MNLLRKINNKLPIPRLKFPIEIEFEPIQLCNALCFTCPYTFLQQDKNYRGKKMGRDNIDILLSDFGNLLKKNSYRGKAFVNPFRYSDPLVNPDLDLVFEISKKFNFNVRITTNGVSFTEAKSKLINDFIDKVEGIIRISVIGSTAEKIKKNMNVNLDVTLSRLENVKNNFPKLASKIKVGLAEVDGTQEENNEFQNLEKKFSSIGYETYRKKKWIENRIDGKKIDQSKENFIAGCNLFQNKLLRRMEVMYDGFVVLCDDDAIGRKKFGNVFEEGIENIWNNKLFEEHKLIFSKYYSDKKNELICKACSRGAWNKRKKGFINSAREIGYRQSLKNIFLNKVNWI